MQHFEDVSFTWNSEKFTVPANKVFGLIARIEENITFYQLSDPAKLRMSSLASAYSAALNYAGAKTTSEDVYVAMFQGKASASMIRAAIDSLQLILTPPSALKPKESAKKKPPSTTKTRKKGK